MARGKFITFEGGEGAGKSTQVRLLAEALRGAGLDVLETREPGGCESAEEIRRLLVEGRAERWDPMTEALLHFAARREHLVRTVWPALEAGRWVVSDRFADSTLAYQGVGQGLGRATFEKLYELTVGDFMPDLTLIFDLPVEVGLARAEARAGVENRYESMGLEFHRKLRQAFLEIAEAEPARCAVIAADRPPEAVQEAVLACVTARLEVALPPPER